MKVKVYGYVKGIDTVKPFFFFNGEVLSVISTEKNNFIITDERNIKYDVHEKQCRDAEAISEFKVGDEVFDDLTQSPAIITQVEVVEMDYYYLVDNDYLGGARHPWEVCNFDPNKREE